MSTQRFPMFESGAVTVTVSGRRTSPFPSFRGLPTSKSGWSRLLAKVDEWLVENANAEAATRDVLWTPLDPKNLSHADKDAANALLFDPATLRKVR